MAEEAGEVDEEEVPQVRQLQMPSRLRTRPKRRYLRPLRPLQRPNRPRNWLRRPI